MLGACCWQHLKVFHPLTSIFRIAHIIRLHCSSLARGDSGFREETPILKNLKWPTLMDYWNFNIWQLTWWLHRIECRIQLLRWLIGSFRECCCRPVCRRFDGQPSLISSYCHCVVRNRMPPKYCRTHVPSTPLDEILPLSMKSLAGIVLLAGAVMSRGSSSSTITTIQWRMECGQYDGQDPSSEYSTNTQLGLKPLENKLPNKLPNKQPMIYAGYCCLQCVVNYNA